MDAAPDSWQRGARHLRRWLFFAPALLLALGIATPSAGQSVNASAKQRWSPINIAVYPDSISPREIRVKGRQFRIRVSNHAGAGQIKFDLVREAGPKLSQVQLGSERSKKSEEVTLEPGTYLFQVAGRPVWTCRIQVSAASN